jgi:hypothetical protein
MLWKMWANLELEAYIFNISKQSTEHAEEIQSRKD